MFDEHRRPVGRLFYLLAFVLVWIGACWGTGSPYDYDQRGLICPPLRTRKEKRCDVICIRGTATDGCRDFPSYY